MLKVVVTGRVGVRNVDRAMGLFSYLIETGAVLFRCAAPSKQSRVIGFPLTKFYRGCLVRFTG